MSAYLLRDKATEELRALGFRLGKAALANMASDGAGPRYFVINGRAVYTREDLLAWIEDQAKQPPRRRGSKSACASSPTREAPADAQAVAR